MQTGVIALFEEGDQGAPEIPLLLVFYDAGFVTLIWISVAFDGLYLWVHETVLGCAESFVFGCAPGELLSYGATCSTQRYQPG